MKSWRKLPILTIERAKADIVAITSQMAVEKDIRRKIKLSRRLAFAGTSTAWSTKPKGLDTVEKGLNTFATRALDGSNERGPEPIDGLAV